MADVKQIKDPVHGYIPVKEDFVRNIIDTQEFQRLRNLKQLGTTYLVYPAANHTRFEHSLGVYHLAQQAFSNLREDEDFNDGIDVDEIERTVLVAALLHDIGHPPFSHEGEGVLNRSRLKDRLRELGFVDRLDEAGIRSGLSAEQPLENEGKHELLSCVLILEKFAPALQNRLDVDPHEVCSHILGLSIQGVRDDIWQRRVAADLISSPVDVDRLDYITRDNSMTGADVANVDTERMVNSFTTCEESLVLSDKALSTIGNYLEGRIAVYMWVIQHHKSVYANALMRDLIESLDAEMDGDLISAEKVLNEEIDDNYLMENLRVYADNNPDSRIAELYRRFRERDFPHSCWKHRLAYRNKLGRATAKNFDEAVDTNQDRIETELVEELQLDEDDLWLETSYVPSYQPTELRKIHLAYSGEKESVTEVGLFKEREYVGPTPFIFSSEANESDIIDLIRDAFSD